MEREIKHGEIYTCKRLRMLQYLKDKGFLPFCTIPDIDNPKYSVWQFNNSPELEDCIEEYFAMLKNK